MACATPLAPAVHAREQRKTVTVVFCDVTGSTALGERTDPEMLRRVMSRFFHAMKDALERHGGTVEKFVGDAVMAVFGIPTVHEDDALRAVRAAADMRDRLVRLNKELERDHGVTLAARIGVNTGAVVAGDPAGGQTLVTGDAVNVASRLEEAAAPGEILLGEATLRLVRAAVVADAVKPLALKGKADAVGAYRLESVTLGAAGRMRRMASAMVGRGRELAALRHAFERAVADSACQLFTILAPAGVGKSRLIEEFLDRIAGATVLRGRCLPYGDGITYFPVLEIVKQAAGLADFDPPDLVESKICAVLEGDEQQTVVCERVAQLFGVADVGSPEETFWAIRRLLEAVARARPLVLVFDDVQWGEATFLDLVEHVADWSRDAPILLVCMARPELLDARPVWGGGKLNATTISLEPLTEGEARQLMANLLDSADVAEWLREPVAQAAEGNPLFIEETLAMLVDDGLLRRENGRWVPAGDLSRISVPPTIAALLAARLDRLTLGERAVLERASVVGQKFFRGAIRALTPESERSSADEHLKTLVRKELVRPERSTLPGDDAFRFRHLLVRDAAYDAMPKELRAEMHEAFASWLERVAGDRIAEQEDVLGYHLENAYQFRTELGPPDDRSRRIAVSAARRLEDAASRAMLRGDAPAALNLAERAFALLPPDDPGRSRATRTLLMALDEEAEIDRKFRVEEEALQFAVTKSDRALEWWIRSEQALDRMMYRPHQTTVEELVETATTSVKISEEIGDLEDLGRALMRLASVQQTIGDVEQMLATAERVIEIALGTKQLELDAAIRYVSGGMHLGRSPAERGLARMRELVEVCSGDRLSEATARSQVASFAALLGRTDAGRRELQEARQVFDDLADPWIRQWAKDDAGYVELLAGNLAGAESHLRAATEGWRDLGVPTNAVLSAGSWADSLCRLERQQEAIAVAEAFLPLAGPWDIQPRIELGAVLARAQAAIGRIDEAVPGVEDAEALVRPTGFVPLLADVMLAKAEVYGQAGQRVEAAAAAREALAIYERKQFVRYEERARTLLAELE
jgi:class 3 adenylate cyclase/tetratricopeptide (TPR) repeat protein